MVLLSYGSVNLQLWQYPGTSWVVTLCTAGAWASCFGRAVSSGVLRTSSGEEGSDPNEQGVQGERSL